jgi:hypothetical protein
MRAFGGAIAMKEAEEYQPLPKAVFWDLAKRNLVATAEHGVARLKGVRMVEDFIAKFEAEGFHR